MKAYVFDLDGTLADSMTKVWGVLPLQVLDERGIVYPKDILNKVVALGIPGLIRYYKQHFDIVETEEEIYAWFMSRAQILYQTTIPAKPFVEQALRVLKSNGASLHILTGSPHSCLDAWLARMPFKDLFDNVWSVDDFPIAKENPALYQTIANRLGLTNKDCVMVDDSKVPLIAAKQAGWNTIGVYDIISKDNEKDMREIADKYVYSFEELCETK